MEGVTCSCRDSGTDSRGNVSIQRMECQSSVIRSDIEVERTDGVPFSANRAAVFCDERLDRSDRF